MIYIEIIAAALTLLSVYLSAKQHTYSWPVGLLAICFYAVVFFNVKLYADLSLQVIFFIQGVMGMIDWYKHKEINEPHICKIEVLSWSEKFMYLIAAAILYATSSYLFSHYTNASSPYIDSLVATLSLTANYLLVRRKIENWHIWILADIIYTGLFIYKGMYVSAVLYFILFGIAIKGYLDWTHHLKTHRNGL